ncbi:MAG: rod shape-determining protein MreC [Lachnospiraceae bacterium]|nr:rod shape-determining protein MreC [Lachnospiraceae bacterium]
MAQTKKYKRKKNRSIPPKYLLLGMTVLCVVMILTGLAFNLSGGPLQAAAGYVFVPMQEGINRLGSTISSGLSDLKTLREVEEENAALKSQVNALTEELNQIKLEQYDVENYRALLKLDEKYPDYEKVAAHVIGKDAGNWFATFLIDKGSNDGISVDMNVIADEGLVGIVTAVGPTFARVRSIIDDAAQVSAQVLSTSDNCIVSGDLPLMNTDGRMLLSMLKDEDDEVVVGDQLVTSNVSSKYVQGLLIGNIASLSFDSNQLTKSGTVTPVVDFEHLSEVLVILEIKDNDALEG